MFVFLKFYILGALFAELSHFVVTISPDGRHMVAVGDSTEVFMFNITNSGEYVHTVSLCGKSYQNLSLRFCATVLIL